MKKRVIPRDKFRAVFSKVSDALDALSEAQELAEEAEEATFREDKDPKLTDVKAEISKISVDDAYEVLNNLHSYLMKLSDAKTEGAADKVYAPSYFVQ